MTYLKIYVKKLEIATEDAMLEKNITNKILKYLKSTQNTYLGNV